MRKVSSIPDIQKVLNQLLDNQNLKNTKDNDFKGLRIKNASPAVDQNDYVTLSQLQAATQPPSTPSATYTMVFSRDSPGDGDQSPPYNAGTDRDGTIIDTWIAATAAPTSDCHVNFTINGNNLLSTDIILPLGITGPVHSAQIVSPIPAVGIDTIATMVVVTAGGVGLLSGGIVVRKSK